MSSEAPPEREDPPSLSKGEIFDVLRNQRRRFVLQYLKRTEGPVELGELATQVAAWEYETPTDDVSSEQRKRVYTTLQQTHLSKMDEAGIIAYDVDEGRIWPTEQTKDMTIYLEIVPGREFPWREFYLSLGAVSCALVATVWFGVYPFTITERWGLPPGLFWGSLIAVALTLSATYHIYRERDMRLDSQEPPLEIE